MIVFTRTNTTQYPKRTKHAEVVATGNRTILDWDTGLPIQEETYSVFEDGIETLWSASHATAIFVAQCATGRLVT